VGVGRFAGPERAVAIGVAVPACLSFNLLLGQGGMLSFGHATYTGMGAFAAVHALNMGVGSAWAVPLPLLPLVGGLAGMALAAVLAGCTRRAGTGVRHDYPGLR